MIDAQRKVFRNLVLHSLEPEVVRRLELYPVRFEVGHELEFPGQPIRNLFFVEEGMASMTNTFGDGCQVEVGMFGYESVIGVSALMGTKRSLNRVYTQIAGSGYGCSLQAAEREFARGELFHNLALRCVQSQLVQAAQSAGCNAKHSMEKRLARWLLLAADRCNSNSFRLSHEFMSDMLGSTRPTLSIAAAALKSKGLIRYSGGMVEIADRRGLERQSCECYRIIRDHLQNLTEFDSGLSVEADASGSGTRR